MHRNLLMIDSNKPGNSTDRQINMPLSCRERFRPELNAVQYEAVFHDVGAQLIYELRHTRRDTALKRARYQRDDRILAVICIIVCHRSPFPIIGGQDIIRRCSANVLLQPTRRLVQFRLLSPQARVMSRV